MRKLMHYSIFFFLLFALNALQGQSDLYGIASYYGDEFQGGETASGERYDRSKLTAGHKTLPLGTRVRVTRLDNNKSVIVRIIDRGPFIKGRIIDLSGKAAETLGIVADGEAEVKLEVLGGGKTSKPKDSKPAVVVVPPSEVPTTTPKGNTTSSQTTAPVNLPTPTVSSTPKKSTSSSTSQKTTPKPAATATVSNKGANQAEEAFEVATIKNYNNFDLYKVQLHKPSKNGFGVQVASYKEYTNVIKQIAELQGKWFKNILVSVERGTNNTPVYKVILGPFTDRDKADSYKRHAAKKGVKGFVIDLNAGNY